LPNNVIQSLKHVVISCVNWSEAENKIILNKSLKKSHWANGYNAVLCESRHIDIYGFFGRGVWCNSIDSCKRLR
jgi:hypothetical protein